DHLELLAAMLHSVGEHYDDARISQVLAMGGEQTKELLSKITSAHSPLRDLFDSTDRVIFDKRTKSIDIKKDSD
ncbi:TPA: hypothetical protein ACSP7Y_005414, partial [Serratia fonticola]